MAGGAIIKDTQLELVIGNKKLNIIIWKVAAVAMILFNVSILWASLALGAFTTLFFIPLALLSWGQANLYTSLQFNQHGRYFNVTHFSPRIGGWSFLRKTESIELAQAISSYIDRDTRVTSGAVNKQGGFAATSWVVNEVLIPTGRGNSIKIIVDDEVVGNYIIDRIKKATNQDADSSEVHPKSQMNCPNCNNPLEENGKFCAICGKPI